MEFSSIATGPQNRLQTANEFFKSELSESGSKYITGKVPQDEEYGGDDAYQATEEQEAQKGFDFDKGGSAIICSFFDVLILIGSITSSVIWWLYVEPVTKLMVGFEGQVMRSTLMTYVDMTNVTTGHLTDGIPRVEYIQLNAVIDGALAILQLFVALVLICTGPTPKDMKKATDVCRMWMLVNIPIIIGYAIWRVVDENWASLIVGLVVRGTFAFKVSEFMIELKRHS